MYNQGLTVKTIAKKIHAKAASVSAVLRNEENTEFVGTGWGRYKLSS